MGVGAGLESMPPPLTSCVPQGESPILWKFQFPHIHGGNDDAAWPPMVVTSKNFHKVLYKVDV